MPSTTMDYYSKRGAEILAGIVTAYWVKQGIGHVVAEAFRVEGTTWGVKSNLVNGLPPPRVDKRGRHNTRANQFSAGKVRLQPRSEPELAAARREFLR